MKESRSVEREMNSNQLQASGSVDRISELPEEILHHILFYAGMRQAVQASILSKTWRHLWKDMPSLNFDAADFIHDEFPNQSLYNLVHHVLSFRLGCGTLRIQKMRFVRLQDLETRTQDHKTIEPFFRGSSISLGKFSLGLGQQLDELEIGTRVLGHCHIQTKRLIFYPCRIPLGGYYSMLRAIEVSDLKDNFTRVYFVLPKNLMIENLTMSSCTFHTVDIILSNLKVLKLHDCYTDFCSTIHVSAPKLLSLECRKIQARSLRFEHLSCLSDVLMDISTYYHYDARYVINILSALHNAETIILSCSIFRAINKEECLYRHLPAFNNLKKVMILFDIISEPLQLSEDLLQIWPNIEILEKKGIWRYRV